MSEIRKKVKDTEYVLVWVPASKEVLEHNYIDTIDFMFQTEDSEKVVVEGRPHYDNWGNGGFREWATLDTGKEQHDLLDLLRATKLGDIEEIEDWQKCLVRITIEVLEVPEKKE